MLYSTSFCQINKIANVNGKLLDLVITETSDLYKISKSAPLSRVDMHHPPLEIIYRLDTSCCNEDLQKVDWLGLATESSWDECVHQVCNKS